MKKTQTTKKTIFAALCLLLPALFLPAGCGGAGDGWNGNAELAREARAQAPWEIPDEIFRNYVLPQTSIGEAEDDWRPLFREKFLPLVRGCRTPTEAAEKLNREMWDMIGVHYSPERDKPDQSPFHSMRIGKASCTGLSILLIDACRAVGVPARFVGCNWKNKPGNHSWVEIWDDGEWKHLGAGDGGNAGSAWFDADAAHADPDDPHFAIYAACADATGLTFPFAWLPAGTSSDIPAINVTERYLPPAGTADDGNVRVSLDLRSRDGVRIAREIVLLDAGTGEPIARGATHDNRFDLNDHLNFRLPRGAKIRVVPAGAERSVLGEFVVPAEEKTLTLSAD